MLNPNIEITLPTIEIIGNNTNNDNIENTQSTKIKNMYKLDNLAIFKNNKLIGYMTKDESITYNLIKNNIKNSIITYECEKNKYMSLEVITSKSKISIKNKELYIDIKLNTNINESNCNKLIYNDKKLKQTNKKIEKYLNKKINNNIKNIIKKYNSDIFGFLDIIYKYDYDYYTTIKNKWYNETLKNIKINTNSKIEIISKGNIVEEYDQKN